MRALLSITSRLHRLTAAGSIAGFTRREIDKKSGSNKSGWMYNRWCLKDQMGGFS
jgi:hypothetical protein